MDKNINYQIDEVNERLAHGISTLIRSLENVQQRIDALNNLTKKPSLQILKHVKKQALFNQDFETCEALKIYAESQHIEI